MVEYKDIHEETTDTTATNETAPPLPGKTISIKEAMSMNRHARRILAKQNGIKKIPSIDNLPKPKIDAKKADKFFNKILSK